MVLLDEPDAGASRCSGRCRRRVKLVEDEGITSPQVVLLKAIDPLWAWQETTRASKAVIYWCSVVQSQSV